MDRIRRAREFERLMAQASQELNIAEEKAIKEGLPPPDRRQTLEEAAHRFAYRLAADEGFSENVYVVNPLCVAAQSEEVRRGFLRKVFGIVGLQLGLMTLVMALLVLTPAGWSMLLNAWWLTWASLFLLIPMAAALYSYRSKHPHNMILFSGVTLLLSIFFGMCCAVLGAAVFFCVIAACFTVTIIMAVLMTQLPWKKVTPDLIFLVLAPVAALTSMGTALLYPDTSWLYPVGAGIVVIFFGFWLYADSMAIQIDLTVDDYAVGAFDIFIDVMQMMGWLIMCCLYAASGRG